MYACASKRTRRSSCCGGVATVITSGTACCGTTGGHDTAALLDECVHAGYLQKYVEPAYNRASSVKFADLPKQAQAVVFSVCFQKGCGGVRRDWPNTWQHLTTQNWPAAAAELQNGFSQYVGRRRDEAALLRELC